MKAKNRKNIFNRIPYEGKEITFQYPAFRGTYGNVAEQIDKEGLKRPNSPETASLVYDAWQNPKEKYQLEIIKILKNNRFWEFTGNLYLPKSNQEINNGVILDLNPKITNGKLKMNKKSLIKRLQENDELVRFVPFGYKVREQSVFKLMKNPYMVARYGEEGAEKIGEVASKYKNWPCIYSFDSVDEERTRMSDLSILWGHWYFGDRLDVGGNLWYDNDIGHAFVKK